MIADVRQPDVTFSDLRMHYQTGRSYTISGTGRDRKTGYRTGVMCNLGDIEASQWKQMVKDLIVCSGEQKLFEQLYEFMQQHNYTRQAKTDLEKEVLDLHSRRIFDNPKWVLYVEFNSRYRPDVLRDAELVWVKTVCCKVPGVTTKALSQGITTGGTICCPHCGRWSEAEVIGPTTEDMYGC